MPQRQRAIAVEHPGLGRRGRAVIIRLHRVDGAALQGLEQLARGHPLVGKEQRDFHLPGGGLVEQVDHRPDHLGPRGAPA
jgi:hypothetical protein